MGPSSPIYFKHLSDILGFIPSNWLATQYLPLISVDQKTDEGLDFPRHINRLHQAPQYKADNEQVGNLKSRHNICDDEVKTNHEVFCIRENTLTPPQSPRSSHACVTSASFMKKTTLPRATEPPFSEAEQQLNSKSCDNDKVESQALHLVPEAATGSASTAGDDVKTPVAGDGIKDASEGIKTHPLQLDGRSSPSNSFFDDAFFVSDEQKDDEDTEMQSIALILDRIDDLLIPLPIISTSGPNYITPDEPSMLSTLNWEYHKQLPPLNIDAILEAALPWAPLPPRRRGQFGEEALEEPSKHPTTNAPETTHRLIGIIGNIEDVEVEECAETKEATKPQPPLKNSLDSLVRLRLQRSAAERAPPSSSHILPPQSKTPKPVLPSANDPGATSKLVSAFMTLRGVKKRRAAPRS